MSQITPGIQGDAWQIYLDIKDISSHMADIIVVAVHQFTGFTIPLLLVQVIMVLVTAFSIYEFSGKVGKWIFFIILFFFLVSVVGVIPTSLVTGPAP